MNTRLTIAGAAAALALFGSSTAALAQEAGRVSAAVSNPVSRAAVAAELAQARDNGELNQIYGYSFTAPAFVSSLSRAEVKAQVVQARKEGRLYVDDSYGQPQPVAAEAAVPGRSRADVKAEVLAARQRGERLETDDRS